MKDVTTGWPEMLPFVFAAIVSMEQVMGPRMVLADIIGGDTELMAAWKEVSAAAQVYIATCDEVGAGEARE